MLLRPPQRPESRRWITLFGIVCVHGLVLWLAITAVKQHQHQAEPVRFLSLINVLAKPKPLLETNAAVSSQINIKKPQATQAANAVPPSTENANDKPPPADSVSLEKPALNLDDLRAQAMKNESTRPISAMEKLQASQKLNLSIEAKMDRELNKIILPECRVALLGKPIIERMQIIQNHNQKKFCRAEM